MSLSKVEYYRKADNLIEDSTQIFQSLFLSRWKRATGEDWSEDGASQFIQKMGKDLYNEASNYQKKLLQEGKIVEWKVPFMTKVLLTFRLENDSITAEENAAVRAVKNIWYKIRLNKGKKLSRAEYLDIEVDYQDSIATLRKAINITEKEEKQACSKQKSKETNKEEHVGTARAASSSAGAEGKNSDRGSSSKIQGNLLKPERVAIIKNHRAIAGLQNNLGNRMIVFKPQGQDEYPLTVDPRDEHRLPKRCAGMERIKICEMDMEAYSDEIYLDCIVHLTLIEDPLFLSAVHQVGQDADGNVTRVSIYEVKHNEETREALAFGRRLSIIHPNMKHNLDGGYGIRVEGTYCLIVRGMLKQPCRYCLKPDAPYRCSKCKKASYCNQECQVADWKKLDHKRLCAKDN